MIIPINIDHRELEREEVCYYDDWEKSIRCNDFYAQYEYTVDEVEFDNIDLEDIVDRYFDDIIDVILRDKKLTKILLKKLKSRKIDIMTMDPVDEKNSKH